MYIINIFLFFYNNLSNNFHYVFLILIFIILFCLFNMFNPLSNNERNFIDNCFKEEIRIDGRNKNDHRNIIIEKKEENGQIYLKLGETIILSQVFAKLINPGTDRQNEGVIVFNVL